MNVNKLGMLGLVAVLLVALILAGGCSKGSTTVPGTTVKETTQIITTPPATTPPTGTQNDANSGGDVSDDIDSPYGIAYGEWQGTLLEDDDGDAYGVRWNPGDTIDIVITPDQGLDVAFYYLNTYGLRKDVNKGIKGTPESIQMTYDITKDIRRFDILISTASGSGDYKLNVVKTPQNDGGKGQDAPGDKEQSIQVSAGSYEGCYLGSNDEFDYYAIKLEAGQIKHITITPSSGLDAAIDLQGYGHLFAPNKNPLEGFIRGGATGFVNNNFQGELEETDVEVEIGGVYMFGVVMMGETKGNYTLTIN
jgi:hypothetical protein